LTNSRPLCHSDREGRAVPWRVPASRQEGAP